MIHSVCSDIDPSPHPLRPSTHHYTEIDSFLFSKPIFPHEVKSLSLIVSLIEFTHLLLTTGGLRVQFKTWWVIRHPWVDGKTYM